MNNTRKATYKFPGQIGFYSGKVRDVYYFDKLLVVIASDRISAFDHILPRLIPYKGQVLNQLAAYFLEASRNIVPNWLLAVPDANVSIGLKCEPIKVEMVIRGYLAGHAWRVYKDGKRELCGVAMPNGMKESDQFPTPIITPATKAEEGHDEDISKDDILLKGIVSEEVYDKLEQYTYELYALGSRMAEDRGLILVDTKYEFGIADGEVYLIDEVHTPDSSRYYYLDGYSDRQASGKRQKQLSKEFVREWLMEHNFQGLKGQKMPQMPDEFVDLVSDRYVHLYELLTGDHFVPADQSNQHRRIEDNITGYLREHA